jgi:hypothetical protein
MKIFLWEFKLLHVNMLTCVGALADAFLHLFGVIVTNQS